MLKSQELTDRCVAKNRAGTQLLKPTTFLDDKAIRNFLQKSSSRCKVVPMSSSLLLDTFTLLSKKLLAERLFVTAVL